MKPFSLSLLLVLFLISSSALAQRSHDEDDDNYRPPTQQERAQRHEKRMKIRAMHEAEKAAIRDERDRMMATDGYYTVRKKYRIQADEDKCDIRLGYGIISLGDMSAIIFYGQHDQLSSPTPLGAVCLGVKYYVSNRFAIGLAGGVEFFKGDIQGDYTNRGYWNGGNYNGRIIAIAPEATFNLFARNKALMYVSLAIGFSEKEKYFHFTDANYNAALQNGVRLPDGESSSSVNGHGAFGIRFGGTIGGFAEFGLGFKGLVNGGLSLKL